MRTANVQVLSTIEPPYSHDFLTVFLPVVRNQEIAGPLMNNEGTDPVSVFLGEFNPPPPPLPTSGSSLEREIVHTPLQNMHGNRKRSEGTNDSCALCISFTHLTFFSA